jgi:hypothetical protein
MQQAPVIQQERITWFPQNYLKSVRMRQHITHLGYH